MNDHTPTAADFVPVTPETEALTTTKLAQDLNEIIGLALETFAGRKLAVRVAIVEDLEANTSIIDNIVSTPGLTEAERVRVAALADSATATRSIERMTGGFLHLVNLHAEMAAQEQEG